MKDPISRLLGINEPDSEEIKQIPIDRINPSPYQPRTVFDDEKIDELCKTIKTHGIIQPIIVRLSMDNRYEIVAGERRWRAAKKIGLNTISAIVKEYNDSQTASIALIENLQREGLTAIEEAVAYQKLIEIHNLTQESLAQRLGKNQSTIANKIRLLNLPQSIQSELLKRKITERHARALLSIHDQVLQEKMLYEIIEKDLNVKQTEDRIKQILNKEIVEKKPKSKIMTFSRDSRIAVNTIRKSIDMVLETGIRIETSERDLDDYYEIVIKIPRK